ncbi:hypothetical protein NCC49_003725 [Naganishia albida]|nr:hypothetical protein NCC49_003725 [Naganishia albida]
MILPTQIATVFAFFAVLQNSAFAATVTRKSESLGRRQNAPSPGRGAGCGQVKSNVPDEQFRNQCVCFDPNTVAVFGETPEVVTYANNNGYIYPRDTSNNGRCNFPPGGPITLLPYSGNCCGYRCTYGPCGEGSSLVCLNQGEQCQSGRPVPSSVTRRSLAGRECPAGLTSCAVEFTGGRQYYECLDTRKDLESCGGCMNPDPRFGGSTSSGTFGMDCSAIPDASEVACVRGQCIVSACERGFELVDGACIEKDKGITAQQLLRMINGFA